VIIQVICSGEWDSNTKASNYFGAFFLNIFF